MMSLGAPGLIALAVVGAWFAMLCIAEWKFEGMFANVLFGFESVPAKQNGKVGGDNSLIHQTKLRTSEKSEKFVITLVGISPSSMMEDDSRRGTPLLGVVFFNFLEVFLLGGINKIALYFSPGKADPVTHCLRLSNG